MSNDKEIVPVVAVPSDGALVVPDKEMNALLDGTTGKQTSGLDNLSIYNQGKEDYWVFGEDKKKAEVIGIFLFSVRPARAFWPPDKPQDGSPPECWSFDGMKPEAEITSPQAPACQGCKWDQLGTAKMGKGRACKTKANDFIIEVNGHDKMPDGKTILIDPATHITGPGLMRYSIANREGPRAWAEFIKGAKEIGRPPQGVLAKWKWQSARNKSNIKYSAIDIEIIGPLCTPQEDPELWAKILNEVKSLKGGFALQILKLLSGTRDE